MPTIGDHLGRIRRQSTLTQEQLAERAGVSVETVRKLEQGERTSARMSTLGKLATALAVPTTALLGDASSAAARREPDHRPMSLIGIRRALTPARGLGGALVDEPAGPPPPAHAIRARLRRADQAYHRGDYATVLADIPELLDDARMAAESASARSRSSAYATLARVRYLACELLIQIRAGDLAHAAATTALDAAIVAGDQLLAASTIKGAAWLLLRQGRLAESERLAIATADAIEPRMSRARPVELATWGWLLLAGAAAAARDSRPDDATAMLDSAAAAGVRLGDRPLEEPHLMILGGFRTARVDMMRVESAAVSGDPERVLRLAGHVPPDQTVATSWRRHRLDVAWSHATMGQHGEATGVLLELRQLAPAWIRHQRYARDIVTTLATERRRAMSRELSGLASLVGCEL